MLATLFVRGHLTRAVESASRGPYVAGGTTARPWIRLALFVAVTALAIFLVVPLVDVIIRSAQAALAGPGPTPGAPWTPSQEWGFLATSMIAGAAQFFVVVLPACLIYRKMPGAFLWPRQGNGIALFLIGFAVTFAILGALAPLIARSFGWSGEAPMFLTTVSLSERLTYAVAASIALAFPVIAEEAIFRGVLLRILGGLTRRVWLIVLLNALLFSAFHTDPDPVAFVSRMLTGAVWTWSAMRLGGIAFAVGSHLGNNLLFGLFVAPLSASAAVGLAWPPEVLLYTSVEVAVVLIAVEVIAQRRENRAGSAVVE